MFAASKHGETDFSVSWYQETGITFTLNMIITAMMPLVEFMVTQLSTKCKQCKDRGYTSNKYQTNLRSIQEYVDLYSGPKYPLHKNCAEILLLVSMPLMYGTVMPMLYPIVLVAFTIRWFNERLLICYFYREPPAYSRKIIDSA